MRSERVTRITGATLHANDPDAMAARWSAVLGLPGHGPRELTLDVGTLRFAPAGPRGEGVAGFQVEARDPAPILSTARERGLEVEGNTLRVGGVEITLA